MLPHRIRQKLTHIALLLVLVFLAATLLPQPASAQSKTLRWHRWDADIQINSDGTFHVKEVYEIEFIGGPFTFGYRNIPIHQFDSLTNFAVSEGPTTYSESRSERAYTYYVTQDNEEYVVNWFYPSTTNATRVFTVEYTVHGGIIINAEVGDRFFWKAVGPEHDYPVESSTVIVRMPPGTTVDPTLAPFYSGADLAEPVAISPDQTKVTYHTGYIPAQQEFEVGVRFPHGFIPNDKPAWQDAYEAEQNWNEHYRAPLNVGLGALGALILLGGLGGVYLLWLMRGRDPNVAAVPSYLTEPPSDLPPGVAGTLVDEQADLQDIIATMIDLARRGVIEMEERENKFLGITTGRDFSFRKNPNPMDGLRPYERTLIREMFGNSDEIELSDLNQKFYSAIPQLQRELYQETVNQKLFPVSPKAVRGRYLGLGIAGGVLTLALGICTMAGLPYPIDAILCPFISLVMVSIGLAVAGRAMPTKTRYGAEEASKWRAFKNYLRNTERFTDLKQVTDQFDQYLPYAIAFGLDRTWIGKFSHIPETPIPRWYVPIGGHGYYGPTVTRGEAGGKLGKAVGQAGRDLRGEAARPGPSLDGMSERLSSGLSGMSGGLIAMLNSTASTFTSVPASSGSSGGGFSGGGFSGGGGGGGGGAGFG